MPAATGRRVAGVATTRGAASDPATGVEQVRWVCGPYRCFWRPNYYGYYGPRPFVGGYYGWHRGWHGGWGGGWRHRYW